MKGWSVLATNFPWHDPVPATGYIDAMAIARARGWEASIQLDGETVAGWSPLYGGKIYDRRAIEEAA
jgi:hypothetical protein